MEKAHMTGYFIATEQKIPDWIINITFLEKVETAISLGIINLGLVSCGFKHKWLHFGPIYFFLFNSCVTCFVVFFSSLVSMLIGVF